ncbi:MAG: hypothetical protein Q9163_003687 [Psora crenata]
MVPELRDSLMQATSQRYQIAIVGIESHICVTQTALDLLTAGHRVYILADGVSSCNQAERGVALERLRAEGAIVTTSESWLYECMGDASIPEYGYAKGNVNGQLCSRLHLGSRQSLDSSEMPKRPRETLCKHYARYKTVTETITQTQTQTINETYTVHLTTEIYSTILSTITVPTTIHHTATFNVSLPTTTTLEASPPPSIVSMYSMLSVARVAPDLGGSHSSSTLLALSELPILIASESSASAAAKTSKPSPSPLPSASSGSSPTLVPTPAAAAPTASPSLISSTKHPMPSTTILAIVLGAVAFVGLILAGLLFARRMYRMYRQQRVLRKQIQTEGNEMPAVNKLAEGEAGIIAGTNNNSADAGAAKAAEAWEEYPPAYRV